VAFTSLADKADFPVAWEQLQLAAEDFGLNSGGTING
jgi:hypothetical protein